MALTSTCAKRLAELLPTDCFELVQNEQSYRKKAIDMFKEVGINEFGWYDEWTSKYSFRFNPVIWLIVELQQQLETYCMISGWGYMHTRQSKVEEFKNKFGLVNVDTRFDGRQELFKWAKHVVGINKRDMRCYDLLAVLFKWIVLCLHKNLVSPEEFVFCTNICKNLCGINVINKKYIDSYEPDKEMSGPLVYLS